MTRGAWVALGVGAALAAAATSIRQAGGNVSIVLSPPSVPLSEAGAPGEYSSMRPVLVRIASECPYWKLMAQFTGSGPGQPAPIKAEQVWLEVRDLRIPNSTPVLVPLAKPAALAEGGFCPPADVLSMRVIVKPGRYTPPGGYAGGVRLFAVPGGPPSGVILGQAQLQFSFDVRAFVLLSLDPAGIRLEAAQPGVHECLTPMWVNVESNRACFRLKATMSALIHQTSPARIPQGDTCIAWGTTPAQALINVRARAFGANQDAVELAPGQHKLYVAAKARNEVSTPAGLYRGQIQIGVED